MTKIFIQKETTIKANGIHTRKNHKPVMCITTGEVYASVLDAAKANDVSFSAMSLACCGRSNSCKGKRFCFVANVTEHLDEIAHCIRIREAKVNAYDEYHARKEALRNAQAKYEHHMNRVAELQRQLEIERELVLKTRDELRALRMEDEE